MLLTTQKQVQSPAAQRPFVAPAGARSTDRHVGCAAGIRASIPAARLNNLLGNNI
jgi:hypothetical protein